jgi:hypothetical protein
MVQLLLLIQAIRLAKGLRTGGSSGYDLLNPARCRHRARRPDSGNRLHRVDGRCRR